MENMKRALSAFMALVLVLGMLPGVPMFAGAEEVETQPETVAVETTEAATTPETTVPEESVPETTVPEESIPETTVAEEIIPETTVAEETVPETTVPEETVSEETAAVEAAEDLNADAEAADAVINKEVTNILVSAATNYTYVGEQVKLTAEITPADADSPEILFYVVEETEEEEEAEPAANAEDTGLPYDQQILEKKGVLIVTEPCTLTIAAKAIQGTEVYDSAIQEEGGKVTVTFVDYAMQINELAIDKDNWYEGILRVMTGKKLALSANYLVNGEAAPHLPGVNPDITWYLEEGDEEYASVKVNSDNCMEVEVTAKTVTESKTVTLYARENTLGTVDSIQITVYPIPYKVGIYCEEAVSEENPQGECTNDTIIVPLVASQIAELREQGIDYLEIPMTAQVWPLEAEEPMVWTTSNGLVQVIHPDKEGEEELLPAAEEDEEEPEKDTTKATLRVYFYEDDTTITIASENYPDVKSTVKIVRKWSLAADEIDFGLDTENLQTKGIGLVAGQSFQLEIFDIRDKEKPVLLDGELVKWSLSEEDQAYATVTEGGKLTAKKDLSIGAVVTVKCTVINNKDAVKELQVPIRPKGTEVRILPGDLASEGMPADLVINDFTIPVNTADGCAPFALKTEVHPCGEDMVGALQDVTWKSSNTSIATYDEVTEQIKWEGKNGTVTFTATADYGVDKKVKASVTLKFCVMATGLQILERDEMFLRSGESWTMDVEFAGNPTDKSVSWYLIGEDDGLYATLNAKGKLTAKTVYEEHTVTVLAMANDGSGVHDILEVLIKPKKDGILVLKSESEFVKGYENYVTMTTQIIPVYEEIDLDAYILGFEDDGEETVSWKSSNSKVASVDEDGVVTVHKAGKVTITATSAYDKKNKATVTLQCVSMVDTIEWTHSHEQHALACGKSLTLKAKAYDLEGKTPTISKLQWVIADNGAQYAKVSNGKVTAYANALAYDKAPVTITVLALATDGSGIFADWDITIYPIVQSVTIEQPEEVYVNMPSKGTNTLVMTTPGDTLQLNAKVFPENAAPEVTWKSSNAKVASIDADGLLTVNKAGTVTITATAADGSGKKATYKLSILAVPDEIEFDMDYLAIAGGKNLKMKPVLFDGNGDKISGKKFEWKVTAVEGEDDGTAYVTSISGGTLKTKKVTSPKVVEVTVRTVEKNDEWEVELTVPVEIYPAATAVKILDENDVELGRSHWADLADEQLQLQALVTGKASEVPFDGVTWKSSNTKVATVDEDGLVTFLKTGTVTIYAYAADGTSVKDYVKLTIRK